MPVSLNKKPKNSHVSGVKLDIDFVFSCLHARLWQEILRAVGFSFCIILTKALQEVCLGLFEDIYFKLCGI